MSFDSLEKANTGTVPVEFFQFQRGTEYWRYTTADRDVVMNGVSWSSGPITRDSIIISGNSAVDTMALTVRASFEPVQSYRGQAPSGTTYLTVFRAHATQFIPTVVFDGEIAATWVGTVSDVKQSATDKLTIQGSTLSSAFDREGLRQTWNRNCTKIVFDRLCRLDRNLFVVGFNVETLTGNTVGAAVLAAHGDGYYDGGYIEYQVVEGVWNRLGIERQVGSVCTLLGTTESINIGRAMNAYPGCPQTIDACQNKFNNVPNFGGIPIMPGTSPFDGNPIF